LGRKTGAATVTVVGILIDKVTKEVVEQIFLIDNQDDHDAYTVGVPPILIDASADRVAAAILTKGVVLTAARTRQELVTLSSIA
jgi:hypothetical protein